MSGVTWGYAGGMIGLNGWLIGFVIVVLAAGRPGLLLEFLPLALLVTDPQSDGGRKRLNTLGGPTGWSPVSIRATYPAGAMSRASRSAMPVGWEAFDRRHRIALCRYLQALGASDDQAEDLAQEAFLVAVREGFEDRGEAAAGAWLRRTARHVYLRMRRDQGRREELIVEQADRLWERYCRDGAGEAWLAALRVCVEQLGERPRAAVRVFYGEGRDRASAATVLGIKETGLKTLLQRLRRTLRACIERRMSTETGHEGE